MANSQTPPANTELDAANARIAELEAAVAAAVPADVHAAAVARVEELEDQLELIAANATPEAAPVVYAPPPPRVVGEGWPVGVFIGIDVTETFIDDKHWAVDPKTGCITRPAKTK